MELRNCRRCKKLFVSVGRSICPKCVDEEEKQFEIVRKYLEEHPHSTASQIAKATNVPEEQIIEFVKSGRLTIKDALIAYECEICGRPIYTGKVCIECRKKLFEELQASIKKSQELAKKKAKEDLATKFIEDLKKRK